MQLAEVGGSTTHFNFVHPWILTIGWLNYINNTHMPRVCDFTTTRPLPYHNTMES